MKALSKTLNKEFDFVVNHLGLHLTDELHICDKYIVIIEEQDFKYSCGIGHRVELDRFKKDAFIKVMNRKPQKTKSNLYLYINELRAVSNPKPLNIDDILYSLILDSQAGAETFDDFCDNFGYDNDSIKASEIYKSCQKNGKKVKTFITDIDKVSELFQDY